MNYRIVDGYIEIACHECGRLLEEGELLHRDNNIYCTFCNAHLGYEKDLSIIRGIKDVEAGHITRVKDLNKFFKEL